jgi:arsenite-transporting ATPase
MALAGLDRADLKLIFFGGKGGVGKTSCAVATAIELSKKFNTLLISTDPAHSLRDSLEQPIGYTIKKIEESENLSAIEIAGDEAFEHFKQQYQGELKKLFDTSTNLDEEDIEKLLNVSIPGIDELMSLKTIIEFIQEDQFEKYVVDTAPTGHALRLLSSPRMLDQWIKVAVQMRWKYRYMITSFSGSYKPDDTDQMLLDLKKTVNRIDSLLRDGARCEFIPVCTPEEMVIKETDRLLSDLQKFHMPLKQIIINHVMKFGTCDFCIKRRMSQQKYIEQLSTLYGANYRLVDIPLFPEEVKGMKSLREMGKFLFR